MSGSPSLPPERSKVFVEMSRLNVWMSSRIEVAALLGFDTNVRLLLVNCFLYIFLDTLLSVQVQVYLIVRVHCISFFKDQRRLN